MENTRTIDMLDAPGVYGTLPHTSHYSSKYAHTSSAERELTGLRASQACIACRKQKRKCDKTLPACSLCVRMSRGCDYSDSTPTPNADDFAILRQKVSELESRLEAKSAPPWGRTSTIAGVVYQHQGGQHNEDASVFPAAFLLDAAVFKVSYPVCCGDRHLSRTYSARPCDAVSRTLRPNQHIMLTKSSRKQG